MIKELKNKIFLLVMVTLSLLIISMIIIFATINYSNVKRTNALMMDRVSRIELDRPREFDKNEFVFKENENVIFQIRMIFINAAIACVLSLFIIYKIARKLSEIIVKPVQETLEKQKQFISDASHELKTPLAVIEANADVLDNEIGENKWLGYIQNEISSMDKLINELLLLAKTENVDSAKEYSEFNLSKEAEMIAAVFEGIAYEKKVKLVTNIQENLKIYGDKEDFKHILSTLIDNAIKHSFPDNDVTIDVSKEKNEIIIQVKNMGEEIPEEDRSKIFERFYRVDKARNRNEKRYGLGLAIAKSAAEKYNGKIEVFCEDNSVKFRVSLSNKIKNT